METRELGRSGLDVSRLILGCGNFGGIGSAPELFGKGDDEEQSFALMDAAVAAGIAVFDTADAYGGGASETMIGRWLRSRQPSPRPLLSTKTFNPMDDGEDSGLAAPRVRRQVDSSLRRLGVDRVDMYLIHAWDDDTPIAETLGALDEAVQAGKVRAIGASNVTAERLHEALACSAEQGLARFEWVQNSYSLLDREPEDGVFDVCREHGLGFTPFSPLAGGWLTGKYRRREPAPVGSRMSLRPEPYRHLEADRTYEAIDALSAAAAERSVTPAALALAWTLSHPAVTAAVIGPRRLAHLHDAVAALAIELDDSERDELAELFA
jgi:aryl-alcohol dehydrogenase-like predicted oxidoreductase